MWSSGWSQFHHFLLVTWGHLQWNDTCAGLPYTHTRAHSLFILQAFIYGAAAGRAGFLKKKLRDNRGSASAEDYTNWNLVSWCKELYWKGNTETFRITKADFCSQDALPFFRLTVSKHWGVLKALTATWKTTTRPHPLFIHQLTSKKGDLSLMLVYHMHWANWHVCTSLTLF